MSEKETEDIDLEETDSNDTWSEEETTDEVTLEDYIKQKSELEKARKKIAHLEKEKKLEKKETPTAKQEIDESVIDALMEKKDFYKSHEVSDDIKKEIEDLYAATKGKFSRAKLLSELTWDAEIDENRKVYSQPAVTGEGSPSSSFREVSVDAFDAMKPDQQKKYIEASTSKFGGVKFK